MKPARILAVFGTRPEAIKMAPVVGALRQKPEFDVGVCVTAQHRDLLDQVLSLFAILPDHDLDIMRENQDLCALSARLLAAFKGLFERDRANLVLVHGDTTTCLMATLAAFYAGIPVAHVEAGLRTHDLQAPFPEEANRVLTARLASYHFAPTELARANLLAENIDADRIWVTGNTGIDALFQIRGQARALAGRMLEERFGARLAGVLRSEANRIILVTGHRRENFGQGVRDMCSAIAQLARAHTDWHFVYPVHLNPNVYGPVSTALGAWPNVHLLKPLDYLTFVWLMDKCDLVLTDSGGIQEEAPSLGKPVLVMRTVTERPEAVEAGTVQLVGTSQCSIVAGVERLLIDASEYKRMARALNPYGDGTAAAQIVNILTEFWINDGDRPKEVWPTRASIATAMSGTEGA